MSRTMKTAEVIYQKVKALPEASQGEVLDFVDYLTQKLRREKMLHGQRCLLASCCGAWRKTFA